jgi:hypothetical protein
MDQFYTGEMNTITEREDTRSTGRLDSRETRVLENILQNEVIKINMATSTNDTSQYLYNSLNITKQIKTLPNEESINTNTS